MLRKSASLCVSWKTKGNPPDKIRHLLPKDLQSGTSAFLHWADYKKYKKMALWPSVAISWTCTVRSLKDHLAIISQNKKEKKRIIRESFYFLHTDFTMKLGSKCEDYIAVYTGEDFRQLNKDGRVRQLPHSIASHPMMKAVMALSKATLKTFCYTNLEEVITGKNVIYVALLYMNDTPAYYVGQAKHGIKNRWCKAVGSHCKAVNNIIGFFESSAGRLTRVVNNNQQCHLAIAGAVLKQVATNGTVGVVLFAIDFCQEGNVKCCNTSHKECMSERPARDHHEQHYINAFAKFPKIVCLNAKLNTCRCHDCSECSIR